MTIPDPPTSSCIHKTQQFVFLLCYVRVMCYQFDARSKASQHFQRHSNCSLFTLTFKLNLDFFFSSPHMQEKKRYLVHNWN